MLVSIAGAEPFAYITNINSNTVSVIDTATNTVTDTVNVGYGPQGVAVTPDGTKVYVTNPGNGYQYPDSTVSVIDTATNTVTKTVSVGVHPIRVAVTPDGTKVYVTNSESSGTVSVINTATNTVTATVPVGAYPMGLAVTPDGTKVYVAVTGINAVSVIDTETNTVTATINDEVGPAEVVVNPEGTKVYVAHPSKDLISVIDVTTNTVTDTLKYNIDIGSPYGITVNPTGTELCATHHSSNIVSVTDTATNTVTAVVPVGYQPEEVAVTPDGTKVYVTNSHSNNVSVIDTDTNTVIASVNVGQFPYGVAITPLPKLIFPVANFSSNVTEGYAPLTVQFTDLSENATGVSWNFGNGFSSTEQNPTHTYSTAGTYIVNLTASNESGTNSTLGTITVLEKPILPLANFSSNVTEGYVPLSVQFTDLSVNSISRNWDFENDGIIDSIEEAPVYTYTNPGTYTVNLTASNPNGTSSKTATIIVLPALLKTPTITWNNPADIKAGTALSSEQLNAIATDPNTGNSVPGTFVYTPAAGTVLSAGSQTLHVDFTPTDAATYNTASKDITINVLIPPPTINSISVPLDPVPVGTSITASANVTYLGSLDELTAGWDWGDGSTPESQVSSSFATSHVYNSPGVYTASFTVKDNNGGIATQKAPNCVVVYDPQGGFVTGGGWINSPAGAYVPDNTLAGKAMFGFVSKYQKATTVPTGKTEFQFNLANLNFSSESYDWLIVAGSQAKYKGTGTINGKGNYGFILNAVDGAIKGDGVDRFRIKIWDKESGNTIYDNEIGTSEDLEPSTAISGGSVIIHKKK
ncbi:PKD domain-containing protein [Methanosarcina sp.]|uniref:PKD domain-containing protein n=1 Tax=Methanosarcina sp. TaxID=2213 RepID=UPI003C722BF7